MNPYRMAGRGADTLLHRGGKSKSFISLSLRADRAEQEGFTRAELLAVMVAAALLAGVVLPLAGNTKARGDQVACANNLRRIGQAVHVWGDYQGDMSPFRNLRPPEGSGGTGSSAAWICFAYFRQQLGTPKVLVCPGDTKWVAQDFSASVNGGFINVNYQDRAVSYTIGLHAVPDEPFSIISSDRNLPVSGGPEGCSVGINNALRIAYDDARIQWTNAVHYPGGNVLFNSGAVEELSKAGLTRAIQMHTNSIFSSLHLLIP